jgi:GT2 family glycosyltransferase
VSVVDERPDPTAVDEPDLIDADDPELVAPPVVAVVVVHDPGSWFEETLVGLRDTDYPSLSVLVIDTGSEVDPTSRVAAVLPDAYVRRLDANPGFGAAANEVLTIVEGAAFHLLLHDDVALAPDAVRNLVQEAFRSNAGIVGPKLVMWDDTSRLLQVGMAVDKSGHEVPSVERGELDQEQHDAVRDVFCIPGAATLVRADLFATLGGFDPTITFLGEDLDLCWRAQVAGARVLVVPAAVARHVEALGQRDFAIGDRRRLVLRHRLYAVLTNYTRFHRIRVVPQVALLAIAEVVYATLAGRRLVARAVIESWRWNRANRDSIKAARVRLDAIRSVPDKEVRRLQARGSARFALFVRGQVGGGDDRMKSISRSAGDLVGSLRRGPTRAAVAVWAVLLAVVLFGSRHFLFGDPPSLVDLPQLPVRPWPMLAEWLSGWRSAGLGREAPQPTAFGLLGVGGTALLGSMALLSRLLVVVPLLVGPLGASRLVAATGSRRARWVAAVTYATIPVPYDALAHGRWGGAVAWAILPWLFGGLVAAVGDEPYRGPSAGRPEPRWRLILRTGLLAALLAAVAPLGFALPFVLALVLVVGGLVAGRVGGALRVVAVGAGASVVAAVLHLPSTVEFLLPDATWAALGGATTATPAPDLAEVLRFELGPIGAAPIGWVFLVAAALPLVLGRAWRLRWAVRAWVLAAAGWAALLATGSASLSRAFGPPELLLAPAALGLSMATALGMVAFEVDLPGYRFGWRQAASFTAAAAVAVGTVPILGASFNGAWSAPRHGITEVLGFLDVEQANGAFRTLWMGDPAVLPLGAWQYEDGVGWALTDLGNPNAVDRWPGSPDGTTSLVSDAVDLAVDRETTRLGRLLAPMGIRYFVVVEADRPLAGAQVPVPPAIIDAFDEQLDVVEVRVDDGLHVYRNYAWFSSRSVLADATDAEAPDGSLAAAAGVDGSEATPALLDTEGITTFGGPLQEGDVLWHAAKASSGWSLGGVGEVETADGFGFGTTYTAGADGDAELDYSTPVPRLLFSGIQAAAWVLVVLVLLRSRRRRVEG